MKMEQMCEVLFKINPKLTVENLMTIVRQLADNYDVDVDMRTMEIEYDDNGMNPQCWISGDMPDTMEHWQRLDSVIDISEDI